MTALRQKVKNGLDEARILVLGTQVLLGFQYRAFFEQGFARLPAVDQTLELLALFLLLLVLALLFLAPARHRIIEDGVDTGAFHRFAMLVMRCALLPFACALGLELFVAGDRIGGRFLGIATGGAAFLFAAALWYGLFLHPHRSQGGGDEDAMEKTPLDHRVVQVLTEARVVLPGAQAMLGFQLVMILMEPFESLPKTVKLVHLAALGFVAAAVVLLMAPAAYHRIVERGNDTERFHSFASRMVLLALAALAPGFACDVYVVLRKLEFVRAAPVAAIAVVAVCYGAWFVAMFALRRARPAYFGRVLQQREA